MIWQSLAAAAVFLALPACQATSQDPGPSAGAAAVRGSPSAAGSEPASAPAAEPAAVPSPPRDPFAIRHDRDRIDLIAGCPHQMPRQRPRGSNCYGIFPEQCGADRAEPFQGQPLTPDARARIEAIAPPHGLRFIRPDEPVIQDLRFGRLNIHLDEQGLIEAVDCY